MLQIPAEVIEVQLANLVMDKKLVIKAEAERVLVYATTYYYAELSCAKMLTEIDSAVDYFPTKEEREQEDDFRQQIRKKIKRLEGQLEMELDELQRQAVTEAVLHGVFLLTGGPGTGKTTTINMIIRYFEQEGLDTFLGKT